MDEIICYCVGVTRNRIVQAVHNGAHTLKAIQESTGACTGNRCKEFNPKGRCCSGDILEIIRQETGAEPKDGCCCSDN